ncbi:cold shock protein 1-like [Cornus florida]|uniref:cold shock protein 1-like n=1 Tax=Cornus florida TaxID=4283 RepID=UPI00289CF600|nr:cold shock protein 1-like [Cornus florida]
MTVTEYENKFTSLLRFAPGIANDEEGKIEMFVDGLDLTIRLILAALELTEYAKAVRKALVVEAESKDSKVIRESCKHNRSMSAFSEGQSSKKCGQSGHYKSQCTKAQVIYFKCGQSGHHKSQCTQIQVASDGCFGCGQQGHRVKDCPQWGSGSGRGGGS